MRDDFSGIVGWQKNSFIDFPGTVATVLFFSGCNLRCPYCHNADLVLNHNLQPIDPDELQSFLISRKEHIAGVVFSGGEPTLHRNLAAACQRVKELGYKVKIDTNGLNPEALLPCQFDYLALDIKTDPLLYQTRLASPFFDTEERLKQSVALVKSMGTQAEIRITVVPELVTTKTIIKIGELINGCRIAYLQPLRQQTALLDPAYNTITPCTPQQIAQFRNVLADFVEICAVRKQ